MWGVRTFYRRISTGATTGNKLGGGTETGWPKTTLYAAKTGTRNTLIATLTMMTRDHIYNWYSI